MIYNYLFVPLGVDSTPIGQRKQIAPLVGAAAIAGGASLLGGILNSASASAANERNLRATRETNKMNYQIANEANQLSQAQFNENMRWLKEQYYDTDQYKRIVDAIRKGGLNPALALGSVSPVGSVGQASPTSFHTAQMEAGHVEPVMFGDALSESVGSATNAYFQNQLLNSQAENIGEDTQTKRINNATQAQKNIIELKNLFEDLQNKLSQRGLTNEQKEYYSKLKEQINRSIDLLNAQFDDLSIREKKQNRILDANAENVESQTVLNRIEAQFKPALYRANLRLSQSQIANLEAAAALSWENAKMQYHERHDMLPKKVDYQNLVNNYLSLSYKDAVSYQNFVKDNKYSDERNALKILSELFGSIPVSALVKDVK